MKSLTVFCDSDDGTTFRIEPGTKDDKARVVFQSSVLFLDLARVRELKKYFVRLEAEVARRPKDVPERPKKWQYGEDA